MSRNKQNDNNTHHNINYFMLDNNGSYSQIPPTEPITTFNMQYSVPNNGFLNNGTPHHTTFTTTNTNSSNYGGSSVYAASYETSHHEAGSVCDDNASVYTGYTESTYLSTAGSSYGILPIAIDVKSRYQGAFDMQKRSIAPFELSTKENEIMLYRMDNADLQRSIIEIWVMTQVHDPEKRLVNSAWYNWVLLDLARRLSQLDTRYGPHKLLESLATELSQRLFFDTRLENRRLENMPFYDYPLFSGKRRARIIRLANKLGDAVCGLSEFIDFMYVLNMTDVAFEVFYEELLQAKWAIGSRIQMMQAVFTSDNPLGPFKPKVDPYNQGIEEFRFLHF